DEVGQLGVAGGEGLRRNDRLAHACLLSGKGTEVDRAGATAVSAVLGDCAQDATCPPGATPTRLTEPWHQRRLLPHGPSHTPATIGTHAARATGGVISSSGAVRMPVARPMCAAIAACKSGSNTSWWPISSIPSPAAAGRVTTLTVLR